MAGILSAINPNSGQGTVLLSGDDPAPAPAAAAPIPAPAADPAPAAPVSALAVSDPAPATPAAADAAKAALLGHKPISEYNGDPKHYKDATAYLADTEANSKKLESRLKALEAGTAEKDRQHMATINAMKKTHQDTAVAARADKINAIKDRMHQANMSGDAIEAQEAADELVELASNPIVTTREPLTDESWKSKEGLVNVLDDWGARTDWVGKDIDKTEYAIKVRNLTSISKFDSPEAYTAHIEEQVENKFNPKAPAAEPARAPGVNQQSARSQPAMTSTEGQISRIADLGAADAALITEDLYSLGMTEAEWVSEYNNMKANPYVG